MSKRSQARKDKKDFVMPIKLVEEELQRSMDAVRNFQFLLACLVHQGGGVLEIRQETMDYVKNATSLDFFDEHDEKRKVYVFKVKFGPQSVQDKNDPLRPKVKYQSEQEEEEEEDS